MRARIVLAMGTYWGGIAYALEVIAAISALGAIGGLPALLNPLTQSTRGALHWLTERRSRAGKTVGICGKTAHRRSCHA
jgi:hypothetical protein